MTRSQLIFYSLLLASTLTVFAKQADEASCPEAEQLVSVLAPQTRHLPPFDGGHFDCGQSMPFMAAVALEDTDDDEFSGREKSHAGVPLKPAASLSQRATLLALSVRQPRLTTLNALCVRLQI